MTTAKKRTDGAKDKPSKYQNRVLLCLSKDEKNQAEELARIEGLPLSTLLRISALRDLGIIGK